MKYEFDKILDRNEDLSVHVNKPIKITYNYGTTECIGVITKVNGSSINVKLLHYTSKNGIKVDENKIENTFNLSDKLSEWVIFVSPTNVEFRTLTEKEYKRYRAIAINHILFR